MEGPIDVDSPCVKCGYNLRGLLPDGRCPECSAEIALSRHSLLLEFADVPWLRRVKLGADLMYWGIVAGLVLIFVVSIGVGVLLRGGRPPAALMMAIQLPSSAYYLVAIMLWTSQEPRVALTETGMTWRRIVRVWACVSVAAGMAGAIPAVQDSIVPLVMVELVSSVAGVFSTFGLFSLAHGFALRIPDGQLARSTNIVKWGLCTLMTFASVFGIVAVVVQIRAADGAPLASGGPPNVASLGTQIPWIVVGCVGFLGYVVLGLWACRLLWRYRKAFRAVLSRVSAPVPE